MRYLFALSLLLIPACHREAPAPAQRAKPARTTVATSQTAPQPEERAEARDAAGAVETLRHYYDRIEAGDYGAAWRMRSGDRGIDEKQFAAHFQAYESYNSQVGAPSRPVTSQGWVWVEVPVMTTGRFLGGKSFGSTGSVTLRRPAKGTKAPPGGDGWRVYPG